MSEGMRHTEKFALKTGETHSVSVHRLATFENFQLFFLTLSVSLRLLWASIKIDKEPSIST